jgi:acetylornithine deacetylase/succinyl-diaminopimelate desuccinylase-like protein
MYRNVHPETTALAFTLRVYPDLSPVQFHDAIRDIQAQARAAATLQLVRIELNDFSKQFRLVFTRNARAEISNFHPQILLRRDGYTIWWDITAAVLEDVDNRYVH